MVTHQEKMEGIAFAQQFDELLTMAAQQEIRFCPLSQLLPADFSALPRGISYLTPEAIPDLLERYK